MGLKERLTVLALLALETEEGPKAKGSGASRSGGSRETDAPPGASKGTAAAHTVFGSRETLLRAQITLCSFQKPLGWGALLLHKRKPTASSRPCWPL